jgi:hypothetical protein
MVNCYLKEIKVKDSEAKDDKSTTDIVENPRRKKKKKIRYEQSLWQVLKNSRYSGLYNMLLDIYQLTYKQRETLTAQDKAKSKVPLPNRLVPFFYVSEHFGIHSIFDYPLGPDQNQTYPIPTHPETEDPVFTSKKKGQVLDEKRVQERPKNKPTQKRLRRNVMPIMLQWEQNSWSRRNSWLSLRVQKLRRQCLHPRKKGQVFHL